MNSKKTQLDRIQTLLQGQSAVWQVASQLAMRGHIPLFPGVDYGYDLKLENGIRIQVKSSRLKFCHPAYPDGYYSFDWRCIRWDNPSKRYRSNKNYADVCDFMACWGIEDNRFWIFPASLAQRAIWFPKVPAASWIDAEEVRRLYKGGMLQAELADKFKTSQANISRTIARTSQWNQKASARRLIQFESRWDLLDTNSVVEKLVESAEPLLVPKEQ